MRPSMLLGALLGAACLCACASYALRSRTIRDGAALGPDQTRLTGALEARGAFGWVLSERDLVPNVVSGAAVADEVTLTSMGPDGTCFSIVERTPALIDMPLGAWAIVVNGEDATIDHEQPAEAFDYDYVGERTIVSARAVTPRRVSELTVVAPEPSVFRVVERRATFCGLPTTRGEPVTLALRLAERWGEDTGEGGWQQYFQWEVR